MKERIIVAAVCVPILFVVLFFLPGYALGVIVAAVCAIAAYELIHAVGVKGHERISIYATFSAAVIPGGVYLGKGELIFQGVLLILMSVMFIEAITVYNSKRQITFAQILITLYAGTIIPYFMSSLIRLKTMPEGEIFVLIPFIAAFVTDGGAYFTGVFFGKRRAFPIVSPKKTVEGCLGGIAAGTAGMLVYGTVLTFVTWYEVKFWALLLYGLAGGVITELGDLAFSMVKREYGIKDYGRLLPGHGGMLDRFDSMIFTAPAMYLMISTIPAVIV